MSERGIRIVDATCPFVKKIHDIVSRESAAGAHIVIIGNPEQSEVQGIKGLGRRQGYRPLRMQTAPGSLKI